MITLEKISFTKISNGLVSLPKKEGNLIFNVLDVTKSNEKYMGKSIFLIRLSIVFDINSTYDDSSKNILKMLLIGDDSTEYDLFIKLTSDYISLRGLYRDMGYDYISQIEDEETYRYINRHFIKEDAINFLAIIKDMGTNYNILKKKRFIRKYSDEILFHLLIDNSSSTYAFQLGYKHLELEDNLITHMEPPAHITILDHNKKRHELKLSNQVNIKIPFHVLIGKNGSGKTYLMHSIIKNKLLKNKDVYSKNELFSRIIMLSNTINDSCYRHSKITKDKSKLNNYHFISLTSTKYYNNIFPRGNKLTLLSLIDKIRDRDSRKEGMFRQSKLLDEVTRKIAPDFSFEIKTNIQSIRLSTFTELVERYGLINLNANLDLLTGTEIEYIIPGEDIIFYNGNIPFTLSSGQYSFLICMFSLISTIEINSLVLIEEPENFLHPSLLTHFINSITHILRNTNSVAIIATHSALVLRETPSEQVTILHRSNNSTIYKKPNIETFGSDTHQIMIDVFGDLYSNAVFREEISKIAENKTINDILKNYSHLPSDVINKIIMEIKLK